MFKSILCYPCSFLTNYHLNTNTRDHKIPIINSMHDHHSILTRIRKEQLILIHKKNFGFNPSNFIYNYFNDMTKKTDEEYKPLKTHQEVLNSLVNSEISLNELD